MHVVAGARPRHPDYSNLVYLNVRGRRGKPYDDTVILWQQNSTLISSASPYVDDARKNSTGTMGASLELRNVSEVLTLRTWGAAVRSVTKA